MAKTRNLKHFEGDFMRDQKAMKKAIDYEIPRKIGNVYERGFKESFDLQRFNDYGTEQWKKRKKNPNIRKTLVGKAGGELKNGFHVIVSPAKAIIRNTRDYASYHIKGSGSLPIRQFMGNSKKLIDQANRKIEQILTDAIK